MTFNTGKKDKSPDKFKGKKRKEPRKPKKISETYLHNAGLYYLQRFAASKDKFRQVMIRKIKKSQREHPDQDYEACLQMLQETIIKFENVGLLNDETYAQGLITTLIRQGRSSKYIALKMREKGIEKELIGTTKKWYIKRNQITDIEQEINAANIFARRKKLGRYDIDKKFDFDKSLGKFARAGFSYHTAKKVLETDDDSDVL